ncbi:hypothetical protein ACLPHM_05935 [Paenalcaligenes sp. Me131]|uniref:hypothetical protein n=1 Tax=Paenalcaligenes sp. Me131 TaxID=3392636 RepID=UPI003D2713F3
MSKKSSKQVVYEAMLKHGGALSAADIAELSGLPKHTAYWSIYSLIAESLVKKAGSVELGGFRKPLTLYEAKGDSLAVIIARAKEIGAPFGIVLAQLEAA